VEGNDARRTRARPARSAPSLLSGLPISELKIDAVLVANVETSSDVSELRKLDAATSRTLKQELSTRLASEDSEVAVTSVGKTLTAARLASGRGVGDLSEATRIRGTLIEAIERDDFDACGADVYARGHVKALAQQLGLDPAQLMERYDEQRGIGQGECSLGTADRRLLRWPRRPGT
jgi:hypothetical protein